MTEQQSSIYEVLKVFVRLCEEKGLRYWITGGTLLGAVRHGGFIPWDDDVDVHMPEEDYRRFLQLGDCLPEGYVIQNRDTDPRFPFLYSKLCNTAAPCPSRYASAPPGAGIDVFYLIPSKPLGAGTGLAFSLVKLVDYALRSRLGWREYVPNGRAARLAYRALLRLPVRRLQALRDRAAAGIADPAGETLCCVGGPYHAAREFFPAQWFDGAVPMLFEELECRACPGWDAWLTQHYGDYLQLPEESERVSHHEQFQG